jgi:hypothetical protein
MYYYLLLTHSWNRWMVLITAAFAIFLSLKGVITGRDFGRQDNMAGASYIGFLHLQAILGLTIYFFFSPFSLTAFNDFGAAMKVKELRYWGVEHITGMVIAVAVAQTGRIKARNGDSSLQKHKRSLIYYAISILMILGTVYFASRPWFRF